MSVGSSTSSSGAFAACARKKSPAKLLSAPPAAYRPLTQSSANGTAARLRAARATTRKERMIARDVMTRDVVSVTPDTPVRKIASLLVKHGIGAVPVIDNGGAPIGIVSEGDLIRPDRGARVPWPQ